MLPNLPGKIVKNLANYPALIKQSALELFERVKSSDRRIYEVYDNLTGLDRVRSLHVGVAEAEKNFTQKQVKRKECQKEVFLLEEARNRINVQMDSVRRSDESFLKLVTELHELSRQYQLARDRLTSIESDEHIAFEQFSSILRHSQAEERIQANRMRQWTVGFSLAAGLIGFGATWIRFRQLDKQTSSNHLTAASSEKYRAVLNELVVLINNLNDSVKSINEAALKVAEFSTQDLITAVQLSEKSVKSINEAALKISSADHLPMKPSSSLTDIDKFKVFDKNMSYTSYAGIAALASVLLLFWLNR
uniref:CHASE3 domain-containing protein n=1 Tax=Trichobilharzia regenti TaxID=157069 RepID=A0AA85J0U0_TRIRE|nr:unnamed protein product [Trichobilharzia regenti]